MADFGEDTPLMGNDDDRDDDDDDDTSFSNPKFKKFRKFGNPFFTPSGTVPKPDDFELTEMTSTSKRHGGASNTAETSYIDNPESKLNIMLNKQDEVVRIV